MVAAPDGAFAFIHASRAVLPRVHAPRNGDLHVARHGCSCLPFEALHFLYLERTLPRSSHGGRHELGQNFLTHRPTIGRFTALTADTAGPILEIGPGDGALTRPLASLGRPLTAIDIDEHRVNRLRRSLPEVQVEHADALRHPLDSSVVVGNIPFNLTTPILRRLLQRTSWNEAILITQWEVARKRAGVGGATMMTAQAAPWFTFTLQGRVPSWGFAPRPSVDGGVLGIERRPKPLVPTADRASYERFVRSVFSGRGNTFARIVENATRLSAQDAGQVLRRTGIDRSSLPRDLTASQWAELWQAVRL